MPLDGHHPSPLTSHESTLHIQGATYPQSLQPLFLRTPIGEGCRWDKMQPPSLWLDASGTQSLLLHPLLKFPLLLSYHLNWS